MVKYLAKLLSPLSQSEYTIKNTKQFIKQTRVKEVPDGCKMESSAVFINVPLEKPIEITFETIYEHKKINASIRKKEMKQFLTLSTKNVHLT